VAIRDPQAKHSQIPLSAAASGSRVRVVAIPERISRQLVPQGVRPGEVLVVKNRAPVGGAILVQVNGATIALGRALARKIMVKVVV
jgi:Fe2+ transport system protein FeoA